MAIKRLHYYDQQFLVDADFSDEQKYHLEMRRRLSRALHSFGLAEGLDVQRTGNRQLTVKPGLAVDNLGRELILEADQVLDVSNATTFPSGATIFVTIAYQESQTDPSTATGAPGNTRFTETPNVQATLTDPTGDGTVIRLARIARSGLDLPGNPGDLFDGGVRQSVSAKIANGAIAEANLAAALAAKVNTPSGLASLEGVVNPGGNIDLVAANTITLSPNNTNKTITIGETHSGTAGNPHNTNANQLLGYDFRVRAFGAVAFTQADATGATRSLSLGVQPRVILALSTFSALGAGRFFGAGGFGFFDAATGIQRCTGPGYSVNTALDWFPRSAGVNTGGIASAALFDGTQNPVRQEDMVVIVSVTATGLTVTLTRNSVNPYPAAGPGFTLSISFFYMGA